MVEYLFGLVFARALRRERRLRDRLDLLALSDRDLLENYRFPRHDLIELIQELEPALGRRTRRANAIPTQTQVLVALRFFASGSFQNIVGDIGGTHVAIKGPSVDENIYVNRKRYHSMNVQVMCDAAKLIISFCARFPVTHPTTVPEERYNRVHTTTRVTVEQTFGILKSRFRCLHKSGGALQYTPLKCCKIIVSCLLLHNRCVRRGIPEPQQVFIAVNIK
ncbi:putative nuclease HARBI1 [Chionoecetes opilio]|uniref:Putative nuclease HARBI1 n=1 Tax=Chionoecetes opilio TaxID=41210 RepID=A0A8J5CJ20_CHIOP|nr:putative nuclease HARBI1 [Chionoecetes opilio]